VTANGKSRIPEIVKRHEADLLADWVREQTTGDSRGDSALKESELREQSREFLALFRQAVGVGGGGSIEIESAAWEPVRDLLGNVSRTRTQQGFSPAEIAAFVFSFKQPLFARLRKELGQDAQALETMSSTVCRIRQSRSRAASRPEATMRAGSPGRRSWSSGSKSIPVARWKAAMISSTDRPSPLPRLYADAS